MKKNCKVYFDVVGVSMTSPKVTEEKAAEILEILYSAAIIGAMEKTTLVEKVETFYYDGTQIQEMKR